MTEPQALALMAQLVTLTNGWDDASAAVWTNSLMDLGDVEAAARAVKLMCNTWTSSYRPPWGRLMECYQATPRRAIGTGYDNRPTMSYEQYLTKLRDKATTGSRDAEREVAMWEHHVATSGSWRNVFRRIDDAD